MSESQAFARQTKHGVVSCNFFDDCGGKADGLGCIDCKRNNYSQTKKVDNYISTSQVEIIDVDVIAGTCEFGDVRIVIGPNYKDCHVFFNGKISQDVAGIYITAGFGALTECRLIMLKPKQPKLQV